MDSPLKLDYENLQTRSGSAVVSAVISLGAGCLVTAGAIYAGLAMCGLNTRGDTESWMVFGAMLLFGAVVAAIGLACALHGWLVNAPPLRLRQIGAALNGAYLVGYAVLLASVSLWA